MSVDPEAILQFWLGDAAEAPAKAEARMPLWFEVSVENDARIRERFGAAVEAAARGELASWAGVSRPALALVVLLDQFSRNIWRGTARAFAQDAPALDAARQAVADWRPFMEGFLRYAEQHHELIARFGRFPYRNAVLGRVSTPEEEAYLAGGGETFGQG